jgi:hypothetical protein
LRNSGRSVQSIIGATANIFPPDIRESSAFAVLLTIFAIRSFPSFSRVLDRFADMAQQKLIRSELMLHWTDIGTIIERKRADGTIAYPGQVRVKKAGKVIYVAAETFDRRKAAVA